MKHSRIIIIIVLCTLLLVISWVTVISSKSDEQKQIELLNKAAILMSDGIYIRAVPLLEEALTYKTKNNLRIEAELKRAYTALFQTSGYRSKYIALLESQLLRPDASPELFIEAAEFYIGMSRAFEAFTVLKDGIKRTNSEEIIQVYESYRYTYETNRTGYDYVSQIHDGFVQVCKDGFWGLARANGNPVIPCIYDSISTFYSDRVIVKKDGEIYAVDVNNNRLVLLKDNVIDINYGFSEDRFPVLVDGIWYRASGEFLIGRTPFEAIGMYNNGYAAAKLDGTWGVIDKDTNWLIFNEHEEIILDELGRCHGQGAVFVKRGDLVYLYVDGESTNIIFDDARPFSNEGYAAVKISGKWGFIDTSGSLVIDCLFDDALSFGQHLAGVRIGDFWGFINLHGQVVIEPVYLEVKSFSYGSAPVRTLRGWDFITLIEYRNG